MTKKSEQPIDETPEDVRDASLDDNLEELTAAEESAADAVQDKAKTEEEAAPKQEYEDDPREELEEAIMAGKHSEKDEGDQEEEEEQDPPSEAKKPEAADNDPFVTVKVDGEERQVRQSQLIATFQKDGAAEKRLQQATELLRQAQDTTKAAEKPTETTTGKEEPGDGSTDNDSDADEMFASIAENLQVGNTKEAVAALKQIIAEARKGVDTAPKGVDQEQVQMAVLEANERERSNRSLQTFDTENPELKENTRLQRLMQSELKDVMTDQIKTVLKSDGYADDDVARVDSLSLEQVTKAHRNMRIHGTIKDDPATTLAAARDRLIEAKLWPSKAPATDRSERKQNALQQPGPRSTPAKTQQQKTPGVQTPADVVAEEQAARGNPTI